MTKKITIDDINYTKFCFNNFLVKRNKNFKEKHTQTIKSALRNQTQTSTNY